MVKVCCEKEVPNGTPGALGARGCQRVAFGVPSLATMVGAILGAVMAPLFEGATVAPKGCRFWTRKWRPKRRYLAPFIATVWDIVTMDG